MGNIAGPGFIERAAPCQKAAENRQNYREDQFTVTSEAMFAQPFYVVDQMRISVLSRVLDRVCAPSV